MECLRGLREGGHCLGELWQRCMWLSRDREVTGVGCSTSEGGRQPGMGKSRSYHTSSHLKSAVLARTACLFGFLKNTERAAASVGATRSFVLLKEIGRHKHFFKPLSPWSSRVVGALKSLSLLPVYSVDWLGSEEGGECAAERAPDLAGEKV